MRDDYPQEKADPANASSPVRGKTNKAMAPAPRQGELLRALHKIFGESLYSKANSVGFEDRAYGKKYWKENPAENKRLADMWTAPPAPPPGEYVSIPSRDAMDSEFMDFIREGEAQKAAGMGQPIFNFERFERYPFEFYDRNPEVEGTVGFPRRRGR
jgi:hypothetical protein